MRRTHIAIVVLALAAGAALLVWRARGHGTPGVQATPPIAADQAVRGHALPPIRVSPALVSPSSDMQLSGRIASRADGAGIAGAELTFLHDGRSHAVGSGPDGGFAFEPPAPGAYQLATASAAGFLPFAPAWGDSPLIFTARPGYQIRDVSIELDPERSIAATIVDPTGSPVPAATLTLEVVGAGDLGLFALPAPDKSDARGRVRFRAPIGTIVEADHPAYDPARERLTADAWSRGELTLRLAAKSGAAALAISGKVIDAKAGGMPGVPVIARRTGEDPFSPQRGAWGGVSDAAGDFEIAGLPAGRYTLTASSTGLVSAHVEGVPAGTRQVVLQLRDDGGWLAGRVVAGAGSSPVASFVVIVSRAVSKLEEHPVQTRSYFDPDGRFLIGPLEPGGYVVRVAASGYAASKPTPVQLTAGATSEAEVTLSAGGSLTGTVVDAASGAGIAGARVELEGHAIDPDLPISIEHAAATGPNGSFALGGLPPGVRSVTCAAPGYHTRVTSGIRVADGHAAGPVVIRLTRSASGAAEPSVEITGIGAALAPQRDVLLVGPTVEGGGAAEAGLVAGDRIVAIDGTAVVGLDFRGAIERIRGPVGSSVALLVRRQNGQAQTITVVRRLVQAPAPPPR